MAALHRQLGEAVEGRVARRDRRDLDGPDLLVPVVEAAGLGRAQRERVLAGADGEPQVEPHHERVARVERRQAVLVLAVPAEYTIVPKRS